MENIKVVIGIKDGVPYIVENSSDVHVLIFDYDVPSSIEDEELDKDNFGNRCIIQVLQ